MKISSISQIISLLVRGDFGKLKERFVLKFGSHEKIFKVIYDKNLWGSTESISGAGSEIKSAQHVIQQMPELFGLFAISSLIDAPCGDFNYMKCVNLENIKYLGVDIVPDIIQKNKNKFGKAFISFQEFNLLKNILPYSDMILSRDMFIHFSYRDSFITINNFKKSKSKYLLTNTYPDVKSNIDISTGAWRPINLNLHPYNFSNPLYSILELTSPEYGRKLLALYELKDLRA